MAGAAAPIFTVIASKDEASYGVLPGAAGAQQLRRVEFTCDLEKDTYSSNEQRTDLQRNDLRHGARQVSAKLSGELSCGSYADLFAATLKRAFTQINNVTGLTLTIATGANGTYNITRAAGDWLTSGLKVGATAYLTGGTAGNINKRFLVLNITATVINVQLYNGQTLTTESAVAGYSVITPGKINYLPQTGHLSLSKAIEKWYADISKSEVYVGLRPTKCTIKMPPSGLSTIEFDLIGQDRVRGTTQYFSSPALPLTTGAMAAVNGAVRVAGSAVAQVTGLELTIMVPFASDPVVGTNVKPETIPDAVEISGTMSVNFTADTSLRDAFDDETEFEVVVGIASDSTATTDAMSFCLGRCKTTGNTKSDTAGKAVSQSIKFESLLNGTNGGTGKKYEITSFWMHDTTVV